MNRFLSLTFLGFFLWVPLSVGAVQLQVGAFENSENAQTRIQQLEAIGYEARAQRTAGQLTRVRTDDLSETQFRLLRNKLAERNIKYVTIGKEPEPTFQRNDSTTPNLRAGLPPIGGYQQTLSDTFMDRLNRVMGTEYVWGAETPSGGFDCSGLLHWLFRQDLPRTVATMWPWVKEIERKQLEPGDFVFFTFDSYKEPDHVGLYLGNSTFVHASSSYGVIKADLTKSYYQRHLYGFGRPQF
jgi:cell wall-associated NlpC family hydrolase